MIYVIQVKKIINEENKPKLEYFSILQGFQDVFVEEIP